MLLFCLFPYFICAFYILQSNKNTKRKQKNKQKNTQFCTIFSNFFQFFCFFFCVNFFIQIDTLTTHYDCHQTRNKNIKHKKMKKIKITQKKNTSQHLKNDRTMAQTNQNVQHTHTLTKTNRQSQISRICYHIVKHRVIDFQCLLY